MGEHVDSSSNLLQKYYYLSLDRFNSIFSGSSLIFLEQGSSYHGNVLLYGSNVTRRPAYLPLGVFQKSWIFPHIVLPDCQLVDVYIHAREISDVHSQRLRMQIWRPVDSQPLAWQLVWQQTLAIGVSAGFHTVGIY